MKIFSNVITSSISDGIITVLLAVLLVASFLFAVRYFAVSMSKIKENCLYVRGTSAKNVLYIILAVALAVRLILSLFVRGYRGSMGTINYELNGYYEFYQAVKIILDGGFGGLYSYSMTLFPLPAYILSGFASLAKLLGVWNINSVLVQFLLKLPMCLCDLGSAYLLYRIASKYVNAHVGLVAAAMFAFCPIFLLGSAISVSVYPMLILCLLLTFYFMVQKNYVMTLISFALAMLVSAESLFLLPVVAVFIIFNYVKTLKKYNEEKQVEIKKSLIVLPCVLVLTLVGAYLISLPYFVKDFGVSPFKMINMLYIKPFNKAVYFAFNSLSVYNIFNRNGARMDSDFPSYLFTIAFFIIAIVITVIIYASKRNRAMLVMLASYVCITLSIYMIGMNELSVLPALATLIMAFILIRDKRLLKVLAVYSVIVFVNYMFVMIDAGFLSNANNRAFASVAYDGNAVLLSEGIGKIINIVCSVIAILTHLYYTSVLLDVSLSDKRKLLDEENSFGATIKSWLF